MTYTEQRQVVRWRGEEWFVERARRAGRLVVVRWVQDDGAGWSTRIAAESEVEPVHRPMPEPEPVHEPADDCDGGLFALW